MSGHEEKNMDYIERDRLLTRIDANLENFLRRFDDHIILDEQSFEGLRKRLTILERGYWMAIGIIVVIQLIGKFI